MAKQPQEDLHRAGLAFLSALVGLPVVCVPAGPFWMGSDPAVDEWVRPDEEPQHEVALPSYWIRRYPVTVAQFRAFVQASGYERADKRSLQGQDDHPVTRVAWHDVPAYCRWLSERSGLAVTLPRETQWEKAARGTDGRIYPWGDRPPTDRLCNFGDNVGGTTAVGSYSPAGDSPYGCSDMAGNVCEWTRTAWGESASGPEFRYPYRPEDGRENQEADDDVPRVVRGGSFFNGQDLARCACRSGRDPDFHWGSYGFRVVVSPISPNSGV